MENTHDYKFWVSLSTKKFDHKPDRNTEVSKLRFNRIYTDVEGFAEGITMGYCYAPIFNSASFGMGNKGYTDFSYSYFISLDVDHTQVPMNDMIDTLTYKPTLAYTSCSNGLDGNRYRLIYCFNDKIEGLDDYYSYVYAILKSNDLTIDDIDSHSREAERYYNGNGCGNVELNITNIIYDKVDFKDYYIQYHRVIDNKSINLTHNTTHTTIMCYNDTFVNKDFECDYWNMRMEDVLSKYVYEYPNIEHTPLPVVDEDTPYIMFPSDYIEIKRYWRVEDGRTAKIKDGEGRRRKLFLNGILRRLIVPSINFDNLIYNLLFELVYYVTNYEAENVIDKKEIFYIARNVMKANLTKYEGLKGTDSKFMVNPRYCEKYGLNKKQVRNIACKMIRNQGIGELFDCSKTDKENLEIMKDNGLDVSLITLKRWRKENGITKYKKNAHSGLTDAQG